MEDFYTLNAANLVSQYNELSFEEIHKEWSFYWPVSGESVLDVGAGTGRDAKWMALKNCQIDALEPNTAMRREGELYTKGVGVIWGQDSLPLLKTIVNSEKRFDLILLSAVWMHVPVAERSVAFARLVKLLKKGGRLVITLRHGGFNDGRITHGVGLDELAKLSANEGCQIVHSYESSDVMSRAEVYWETAVIKHYE